MDRYQPHFDNANNKKDELGLWAIWSCYNLEDEPTNWNEVPFPDIVKLSYENEVMYVGSDLTWEGLYKAADKIMNISGNRHHQFVEAFTPSGDERGVYRLWTGS
jgi:hypothetical protein